MKKLEVIVNSEKLEELKGALTDLGVTGMMFTNIMGYGNERGYTQIYRGTKSPIDLLPKVKVETVVRDSIYEDVLAKIQETIFTGNIGDGKIFVYEVVDAVRVSTGERGESAI